MSLLKQDVASTLHSIPESSQQSIFDTYDSIGQDLHSLLHDWQSGRNDLIRLLAPPQGHDSPEPDESIADSGLGVSIAESGDGTAGRGKRDSCGDWGIGFVRVGSPVPGQGELEGIEEEREVVVVLEGVARGRVGGGGAGIGSRGERIERMRKEREEREEKRRTAEERRRWVGELKDVLGRRRM